MGKLVTVEKELIFLTTYYMLNECMNELINKAYGMF
jgi:hypothetical protein